MPKRRNNTSKTQHRAQERKPAAGRVPTPLDERLGGRMFWVFAASLCLITLAVFRDFVLLIKSYQFRDIGADTVNSLYPQLVHIASYLRQSGLPGWSFSQGMGQNVYPDSLGDPFNWLLYLLGPARLAYGLAYVAILKVLAAGALFYAFLRLREMQRFTATILALCYAFCGTMILGGTWYVYSTTVVYAALALIACECLFQRRHTWMFPATVALIAAFNAMYIYLFGVLMLVYMVVRYLERDRRDTLTIRQLAVRAVGLGLVGLAIGAVFALPSALAMLQSPRGMGPASARAHLLGAPAYALGDVRYYASIILRSFSSDMLGTGWDFNGWTNYAESPTQYCGLLSLLLAPQVFGTLTGRGRLAYGTLAAGVLLSHVFPWLRHAFWLFSGDWFRTLSLFVSITLVMFSARALDAIVRRGALNAVLLVATWIVLLVLLYFPYRFEAPGLNPVNQPLQTAAAAFLTIDAGLILALSRPRLRMPGQVGLVALVSLELFAFSSPTVNARLVVPVSELREKKGYSDETIDALRIIRGKDAGFFRVEKDYSSTPAGRGSLNDAKAQGYFGSSSFHSFNQQNYIRFLAGVGVIDPKVPEQTTWTPGLAARPLLQTFASVRYWLFRGDYHKESFLVHAAQPLDSTGQVHILRNKNFVPLGFGLGRYVPESAYRSLGDVARDAVLIQAFVIPDSAAGAHSRFACWDAASMPATYSFADYASDAHRCAENAITDVSWDENRIEGHFKSALPQMLVFTIPFDAGWAARVDGRSAPLRVIDFGLTGLEVDPGEHTIALRYQPPLVREGSFISMAGLLALATIGAVSMRRRGA